MPFFCSVCHFSTKSSRHLIFHLRSRHALFSGPTLYTCGQDGCARTFNYAWSFRRHLDKQHLEQLADSVPHHPPMPALQDLNIVQPSSEEEDFDEDETLAHDPELSSEDLQARCLGFVGGLRGNPRVTQTNIQHCVDFVSDLVGDITTHLKRLTVQAINESRMDNKAELTASLVSKFAEVSDPFKGIETEALRRKKISLSPLFVAPVAHTFGLAVRPITDRKTGPINQKLFEDQFQYIPIGKLLRVILERPGVTLSTCRTCYDTYFC